MKKIIRKTSSFFMGLLLVLTMMSPMNISALEVNIQEGIIGTVEWSLNQEGVLTLSGGSLDKSVDEMVEGSWVLQENLDKVKKIVINDQVKLIDNAPVGFFKDFSELTTIVGIEKLDLSEALNINYMFMATEKLEELDLSSWKVDNVLSMTSFLMFSGVEKLDISTWNTKNVGQASSAFMTMNNPLKEITLGKDFTLPVPADVQLGVIPFEEQPQYTGNWIGINTHKRYQTYEFMTSYVEEERVPDTYIWEEIYEVSFNSNGGTPVASQNVFSTYPATKPVDPKLVNFEFDGWYSDNETFKKKWDFETVITENMVLYAKWNPVKKSYTITYDSMGGSSVSPETVEEGNVFKEPSNPELAGSTFDGWYTDKNYQQKYDFNLAATKDITVYAKWNTMEEPITPPVTPPTTPPTTPPVLPPTGIGSNNMGWFILAMGISLFGIVKLVNRKKELH